MFAQWTIVNWLCLSIVIAAFIGLIAIIIGLPSRRQHPAATDPLNRKGRIHKRTEPSNHADASDDRARAHEFTKTTGDDAWRADVLASLGITYRTHSDLDRAEQVHTQALEIEKERGCLRGMARQHAALGLIYHTRGNLDQARQSWQESLALFEHSGMETQIKLVRRLLEALD